MGAAPRIAAPSRGSRAPGTGRSRDAHTAPFTELKVTGWTDNKEMSKIINFLERHASRRSNNTSRGSIPPKMVKRHKVNDTTLTIFVRPEDVAKRVQVHQQTLGQPPSKKQDGGINPPGWQYDPQDLALLLGQGTEE